MRRKADGAAFEKEFFEKIKQCYYIKRLPTLNLGYAGITQPADFEVFGEAFSYVELKETASDSFSFANMEQMPEIEDFYSSIKKYKPAIEMRYLVIVHFVKRNKYIVLTGEQALHMRHLRKQLHYDSDLFLVYDSLNEMFVKLDF